MALDKTNLKIKIVELMTEMMEREESSIDEFATRLSNAIDDYVKGAKINYTSGLVAGSTPVTGTFNGSLA